MAPPTNATSATPLFDQLFGAAAAFAQQLRNNYQNSLEAGATEAALTTGQGNGVDPTEAANAWLNDLEHNRGKGFRCTPYVPPPLFCDPQTGTLLQDPVTFVVPGQDAAAICNYSRVPLTKYVEKHKRAPNCTANVTVDDLQTNSRMQALVAKYTLMRKLRLTHVDMPSSYVGGQDGNALVPIAPPEISKCKITGKLIDTAVITPDGTICDKQALLQYLDKNQSDPKTGSSLVKEQLHDFPELTERIATYRRLLEQQYGERFRKEYTRAFENAGFWHRNPFSTMRWRLWWTPSLSFEEVLSYANVNPTTRTAKIINGYQADHNNSSQLANAAGSAPDSAPGRTTHCDLNSI